MGGELIVIQELLDLYEEAEEEIRRTKEAQFLEKSNYAYKNCSYEDTELPTYAKHIIEYEKRRDILKTKLEIATRVFAQGNKKTKE